MKYTTEIRKTEFDENGLAVVAGWTEVYLCDPLTREFVRASLDNVPLGGSIVACAYIDKPELPMNSNVAIIRSADEKSWIHVADYREQTAYYTENRLPVIIHFLGDLPITVTLLKPQTDFDKWNGKKWVIDTEAQKVALVAEAENEKAQRLAEAEQHIMVLERKVRLEMATDEETKLLKKWEIYSIKVADIDTSTAPDIDWPHKP